MRGITALLVAGVLIVSCGTTPSASKSPSSVSSPTTSTSPTAPTPTPSSFGQLLVVAEGDNLGHGYNYSELYGATSIRLVTLEGRQAAEYQLDAGDQLLAVAGSRIFVNTPKHELKSIDSNGKVQYLGSVSAFGFAPNPDGTRWIWGTVDEAGNSFVYEGGLGLPVQTVDQAHDAWRTLLRPYVWTPAGAFVQHVATGLGGYAPFAALFAPTDRLDLDHAQATQLAVGSTCSLGDVAKDGTVACFAIGDYGHLRLLAPTSAIRDIDLGRPRFAMVGDAWFAPSGQLLAVAGASGVGNPIGPAGELQPEQFTTVLVRTDGTVTPFGPTGVRVAMGPQSWLADGRLALWRPKDAAGGSSGIYVLNMSGHGTFIPDPGVPIGVLMAS